MSSFIDFTKLGKGVGWGESREKKTAYCLYFIRVILHCMRGQSSKLLGRRDLVRVQQFLVL